MTTVTEILERLGPPPAEICLDWACQLQQWGAPALPLSKSNHPAANERDTQPLAAWSNFTIDSQGVLHPMGTLAVHSSPGNQSLQPLVAQLECWAGLAPGEEATSRKQSAEETSSFAISNRKNQLAATSRKRSASATNSIHGTQTGKVAPAKSLAHTTSSVARTRPLSKDGVQRRGSRQHRLPAERFRRTAIVYVAATLLVTAALAAVGASQLLWPRPSTAEPQEIATEIATAPVVNVQPDVALSLAAPEDSASLAVVDPANTLNLVADPLERAQSQQTQTPPSRARTGGEVRASDDPQLGSGFTTPPPDGPSVNTNPDELEGVNGSESIISDELDIDVLGELSNLSKTAETNIREHTIESDGGADQAAVNPALTLDLSSPNQLQSFDKRLRPQKPAWQLRLAVDEGLKVVPSEPQLAVGREPVRWVVQAEPLEENNPDKFARSASPSSAKAEVMIAVRLEHQRKTSLRWQIAAMTGDFPGVAIPLDRDWLNRAQSTLQRLAPQLLSQLEETRLLGRTEGLPSVLRTELATRRRNLEAQHKLATRWLEIVADAYQLRDWLDGQIELHARLLDSAVEPAPTILLFGNP